MKEYWILVGSFGSGKSELALNLALEKAKEAGIKTVRLVCRDMERVSEHG